MEFQPYSDRIYLKPIKVDSMLISDSAQFEEMGTVLSVGKDVKFCKPGETIFFQSWMVDKLPEINGEQLYVIPEKAILGKLNGLSEKRVSKRKAS